jgi:hypothetical protein
MRVGISLTSRHVRTAPREAARFMVPRRRREDTT